MTRWEAMLSGSVVISANGSPIDLASGGICARAAVALPSLCFQGTTAKPIWPRQWGGDAVVPACHRKPMLSQNSPSQSQRRRPGRDFSVFKGRLSVELKPQRGPGRIKLSFSGQALHQHHPQHAPQAGVDSGDHAQFLSRS
jgi:hypothetical protein